MNDQPMREMRSDELVAAMENLHQYPRLIAERAYAEGLAAGTLDATPPAPLDVDRLARAMRNTTGIHWPTQWERKPENFDWVARQVAAAYAEQSDG